MHWLTGFPYLRFLDRIPVYPFVEFVVPEVTCYQSAIHPPAVLPRYGKAQ